ISRARTSFSAVPQSYRCAPTLSRFDHLSASSARRAGANQAMSRAADLSPVRAPNSWPALAWKLGLFLTPILIAAGLFLLRQVEVARLANHQLPDDGPVPAFQLVNQDNQSFGMEQLRGTVWIADFVYTSCPGPCPMISSRMSEVQKPLKGTDVKLVTF